jgi:predicted DNA-binding transcriptional regulator AlpA
MDEERINEDCTLISGPAVAKMLGISYHTFLRWSNDPTMELPRGYLLGPRTRRWKQAELQDYINRRDRF